MRTFGLMTANYRGSATVPFFAGGFESVSPRLRQIFTIFFCLQLLDIWSTLVGLRLGAGEGNIFIARLVEVNPVTGLLLSKGLGLALAIIAFCYGRERLVRFVNFWFTGVICWNLAIIARVTMG